jgi:hypothetical protein
MSKNHVVLFSGGYDSTLIVLDILNNPKKYYFNVENDTLDLFSVNHYECGFQRSVNEDDAKAIIFNRIITDPKYKDFKITRNEIDISLGKKMHQNSFGQGNAQTILWISNIIPFLERNSIVYFGYLLDDGDITLNAASGKLQAVFDDFCDLNGALCPNGMEFEKRKIVVSTPLLRMRKSDVLYELFKYDKEYLLLCRNCNRQDWLNRDSQLYNARCGYCESCKHIILAMTEAIIGSNHYSEDFIKFCKVALKYWYHIDLNVRYVTSSDLKKEKLSDMFMDKISEDKEESSVIESVEVNETTDEVKSTEEYSSTLFHCPPDTFQDTKQNKTEITFTSNPSVPKRIENQVNNTARKLINDINAYIEKKESTESCQNEASDEITNK